MGNQSELISSMNNGLGDCSLPIFSIFSSFVLLSSLDTHHHDSKDCENCPMNQMISVAEIFGQCKTDIMYGFGIMLYPDAIPSNCNVSPQVK